jgi:type IV pilus assembly protein PilA
MLSTLRTRLQKEEDGFTLIELMVVVLIIAVLLAIAIPSFLRAQDGAKEKAAQADIRNAVTAAKTLATDNAGSVVGINATTLGEAEPSIEFVASGSSTIPEGAVVVDDTTVDTTPLFLTKAGEDGNTYGATVASNGQVGYCIAEGAATLSASSCTARSFNAATAVTVP